MLSVRIQGRNNSLIFRFFKECVRRRASDSVYAVRDITREEADAAVDRVFEKCYNDMEPLGRRIRPKQRSSDLAYSEAYLLGYD